MKSKYLSRTISKEFAPLFCVTWTEKETTDLGKVAAGWKPGVWLRILGCNILDDMLVAVDAES